MKPLLISVLLFVPFALGARYLFVCETLHWCAGDRLAAAVPVPLVAPDGATRELALTPYAEGDPGLASSAAHEAALDTLAAVALRQGGDYALRIEAPVRGREGGARADYADLGIARAAALAAALQSRGVRAEGMTLHSYPLAETGVAVPRLSFAPVVPKALDAGLAPTALLADSMSFTGLRFGRNSTALQPDGAFATYAEKLIATLNADTSLRLRLIGHTDDRSTAAHNDSLGRWRAEAVGAYLTQRGLLTPVTVETRGAREPVADNATPEGRYLNRRVEARIE